MKITNIGGKAIGIDGLSLLPGETAPLPKDFETNPVILFFEERGFVKLEKVVEPQPSPDENGDQGEQKEPSGQKLDGLTKEEVIAAIKDMKRGELDTLASQVGIEVTSEDTVPSLKEKLTVYYQAQ